MAGDPRFPPTGMYARRKKRSSEPNYSGLALPTASSFGAYGSASKDWENINRRKAQLLDFLSSLQHPTERSVISDKMTNGEMTNPSVEQKERKDVIEISDDEDEDSAGCTKLAPEINKQFTTSELKGNLLQLASNGRDQAYESMFGGYRNTQIVPYDQNAALLNHLPLQTENTQIVPYDQNAALLNPLPLQTSWQPSILFEKVVLQKRPEEARMQDLVAANIAEKKAEAQVFLSLPTEKGRRRSDPSLHAHIAEDSATVPRKRKRKCDPDPDPAAADCSLDLQKVDVSSEANMFLDEEEKPKSESDGLEDYWKDFALAVESTKLDAVDEIANEKEADNERVEGNDCNHDIRIHEDLGHVCRVCGMIVRRADSIIDYQWKKAARKRTNYYEGTSKEAEEIDYGPIKLSEDFIVSDIAIHPRHAKKMRSHQLEGFNFLVKNLVGDKPGGCILAHAPGSGKTFMIISFIQSFLARYPSARPLIVLPKGIIGHWKDEFQQWQVQDIPLYDFYSVKAEKRVEQLEILKSWESKMSILFLGYTQFSRIVSGEGGGNVAAACRDRLLKVPNLLILDEGHKPRNRDTDVLETLNRVETPRKVVLSGTLFQNHVREVFTILDLVRPKFLKMESARPIVRRIMSQAEISGRPKGMADSAFTSAVENTLLHDDNFKRKAHVIRGLRELTKDVLHYYKGDILEELPGLVDFSVFLKLTPKQKDIVHKLRAYEKFKKNVVGASLYIHPCLSEISEVNAEDRNNSLTDNSINSMIDSINVRDGVKARFFMNILSLAESAGEKLLAFSQYILPMKFLERLLVKMKGWHVGKEIFMISGDTSSEDRDLAKDQFNNSADAKVLFGSITACGEGISLVGASRVIILDVHLNPSVTRQAIGRAFRPGQQKKVFVYRLVAAESPEEKSHETTLKKEVIPKLWFEWSEHCTTEDFKLDQIEVDDCADELLDNKAMRQDIKALYISFLAAAPCKYCNDDGENFGVFHAIEFNMCLDGSSCEVFRVVVVIISGGNLAGASNKVSSVATPAPFPLQVAPIDH
ncbi:hypothetical protein EJB05_08792 [Eragrostis curvula]|uniref:Helicase ATP-binding domain-containing protein n=1 Tax=Eragrostis curvula TaxID=38414 RepID=A0A5J9W4Z8_9POAL|nr:hypothetical protein EJB05_08792 [Eragrostis curvula]